MPEQRTCSECHTPLPGDAPDGFCPVCSLEGALRSGGLFTEAGVSLFRDYELLDEIARGGMGVVFRARQVSLDRIVAVKLILFGQFANEAVVKRFRAEATSAARLQHPNIVALHEVGEQGGQHFFSMDYVAGRNLAEVMRDGPLPSKRAARLLKTIAEAIHYAHTQGIVHRDLKPSNILIDELGEPHITDFGLAKNLKTDSDLTLSGQVIGSPNFIAPEQAAGRTDAVGPQSDVYSLGAILYQVLTGQPPFGGETITETLNQVLTTDPPAPRLINPSVPRDLETICLKCLEKEPPKRFSTAQSLADELNRFLLDEPIESRPAGRAEKLWRWCRRKPVVASLGLATLILLLAVAVGSPIAIVTISRDRERVKRSREELRQSLYVADMGAAYRALEQNSRSQALDLVQKYGQPQAGEKDLRGWEWRYLWEQCRGNEFRSFAGHSDDVTAVAVDSSGERLLTASRDRTVRVSGFRSGETIKTLSGFSDPIDLKAMTLSPDGSLLAAKGGTRIIIWRTIDWQKVRELSAAPNWNLNSAVAFSPDGRSLWARVDAGLARWDLATWEKQLIEHQPTMTAHKPGALSTTDTAKGFGTVLAFSPSGEFIAISSWNEVEIRDARSLSIITNLVSPGLQVHRVLALAWCGDLLAGGFRDGHVRVWETGTWRLLDSVKGHESFVHTLVFAPDGKLLASGGGDQMIRAWWTPTPSDAASGKLVPCATLKGHFGAVSSLAFSPDGQVLISGSFDKTAKLWKMPPSTSGIPNRLPGEMRPVAFSSDGNRLATLGTNGVFRFWDLSSRSEPKSISLPLNLTGSGLGTVSMSHQMIAVVATNGFVEIHDTALGILRSRIPYESGPISDLAFSCDDRLLAIAQEATGPTPILVVWDLERNTEAGRFMAASGPLTFSPDGQILASTGADHAVNLWSMQKRVLHATLRGHANDVTALAFSPDGQLLATVSNDVTVRLWNIDHGMLAAPVLRGHVSGIASVAFAPDGRTLVTGSWDHVLKFWDLRTGREFFTMNKTNPGLGLDAVCFSPDGSMLALTGQFSSLADAHVELWPIPSFEEIDMIQQRRATEVFSPAR